MADLESRGTRMPLELRQGVLAFRDGERCAAGRPLRRRLNERVPLSNRDRHKIEPRTFSSLHIFRTGTFVLPFPLSVIVFLLKIQDAQLI